MKGDYMKKIFTLVFVSLLAFFSYANSLSFPEIQSEADQISFDLNLEGPGDNFPLSGKSHEKNIHAVTIQLHEVDLSSLNREYPVSARYWGASWPYSDEYEEATRRNASDDEIGEIATRYANNFDQGMKQDFLDVVSNHSSPVKTTCQMVRIASNWLVGASSCLPAYLRKYPKINSANTEDIAFNIFQTAEQAFRYAYFIKRIELENATINPLGNLFIGNDVILVHLSDAQIYKTSKFSFSPIAEIGYNLSVPSVYLGGKKIAGFSINGNKLSYTKLRVYAGTPIFTEYEDYTEFLLGFNDASYDNVTIGSGSNRRFTPNSGRTYTILTEDMNNFIKNTIAEYNRKHNIK